MEYFYFKTEILLWIYYGTFGVWKFAEVTLTVVCTTIPCTACSSLSSFFFNISFIYFAVLTQLQHVRSLIFVVAYGIFSCSMWDLVLWPGIKLRTPALEVQSLSHWTTRKVPDLLLWLRLNWSFYFFSFMGCAFVVMSKNSLPNPRSWRSSPNTRATNSYPPVVFPTLGSVDKASAVLFISVPCVCAICQPVWNPGEGLYYESVLQDFGSGWDPWLCNLGVSLEVHTSSLGCFSKVSPLRTCPAAPTFPAPLAER